MQFQRAKNATTVPPTAGRPGRTATREALCPAGPRAIEPARTINVITLPAGVVGRRSARRTAQARSSPCASETPRRVLAANVMRSADARCVLALAMCPGM